MASGSAGGGGKDADADWLDQGLSIGQGFMGGRGAGYSLDLGSSAELTDRSLSDFGTGQTVNFGGAAGGMDATTLAALAVAGAALFLAVRG